MESKAAGINVTRGSGCADGWRDARHDRLSLAAMLTQDMVGTMVEARSNIEIVAREICTRLYARHWSHGPELDAEVDRHWHIVAARLEADLMDETGADTVPYDFDREMAALRDWRAWHPAYIVPPSRSRPLS